MKKALLICLLFTGCASYIQKRNVSRLDNYSVRYPAEMSRLSNWLYPCFNGKVKSDTIFLKQNPDTVSTFQTTYVTKHDTVTVTKTQQIKIKIPTVQIITDTVSDLRHISTLLNDLKIKNDSLVVYKTKFAISAKNASVYLWVIIAIAFITVIYSGIKIYKFFTGGSIAKEITNLFL